MAEITIRISDRVLKVGAILVVGIFGVLAFSYLWSSGFFHPKYHLRMYVTDASGLTIGAPVRVDGLDVGAVQEKSLAGQSASVQRRIELVLRVEKRDQPMIRSDSIARVTTDGLLGNPFVKIERGFGGTPLNDGDEIATSSPNSGTIEGFLNSISKMADCIKEERNQTNDKSIPATGVSPNPVR